MNLSAIAKFAEIAGTILGTLAFAFWTLSKLKEKAATKKYGLKPNPTRCGEMIARIENLENDVKENKQENRDDHKQLFSQIGALSIEVAKIGRNGGPK
jgi:hypothetical protein